MPRRGCAFGQRNDSANMGGRFGPTFLPRLAQQRPKIYPSALPMAAALASGEISAALFVVPECRFDPIAFFAP